MRALVTGAAGFIGSHLTEALVKKGFDVTCVARKSSNLRWIEHLDLKYISCDLSEIESCRGRFADFDYFFHLAGVTKALSERDYFFANAECTTRLLKTAVAESPKMRRFVYLSSLAAIGPGDGGKPVSEDSPPSPISMYGRSKLEGEKRVLAMGDAVPFTILRPPGVYGPRDRDFFVMFKMIKKGVFPDWGTGYYSLLYVDDLVRGIIESSLKREAERETFFLGDDAIYTNCDIAREISSAVGSKAVRIRLPRSFLPILAFLGQKIDKKGIINRDRICDFLYSNWTCDAAKAREKLGFEAKIPLREGIKWTADWYRIHRWL